MTVEDLLRVVAARVVDHDHRVGGVRLGDQAVEHPAQEVGPVVGDDDDRDGLARIAHLRYLRCPVKSPRNPANIARALSASRAGLGLVNA